MTVLPLHRLLAALAVFAGLAAAPGIAAAAQSYDNCTGFIDAVPATITTQGVWCLRKNVGTAVTSGNAITIAANNVTIDCNDFKIGGLGAGDASNAYGVYVSDKQNATVRHCSVRGFRSGIYFNGGGGHLIEDNLLDNNLAFGIHIVNSGNNLVQRNRVYDTGGRPGSTGSWGIHANADVIDNTVAGVFGTGNLGDVTGIRVGTSVVVRNNRVRGLQAAGNGSPHGIRIGSGSGHLIDGNLVVAPAGSVAYGINGKTSACSNNVITGFSTAMVGCVDAGGNTSL